MNVRYTRSLLGLAAAGAALSLALLVGLLAGCGGGGGSDGHSAEYRKGYDYAMANKTEITRYDSVNDGDVAAAAQAHCSMLSIGSEHGGQADQWIQGCKDASVKLMGSK